MPKFITQFLFINKIPFDKQGEADKLPGFLYSTFEIYPDHQIKIRCISKRERIFFLRVLASMGLEA